MCLPDRSAPGLRHTLLEPLPDYRANGYPADSPDLLLKGIQNPRALRKRAAKLPLSPGKPAQTTEKFGSAGPPAPAGQYGLVCGNPCGTAEPFSRGYFELPLETSEIPI